MDGIITEPGRPEKQAEESWKGSWIDTSIVLLLDAAVRAAKALSRNSAQTSEI
ncbi:MAG: hypothetical protein OEY86_18540 [Nitrospira sp.]|nr:hypothetical protein [Nitrospira sp.]